MSEDMAAAVRARYADVARQASAGPFGGGDAELAAAMARCLARGYSGEELAGMPAEALRSARGSGSPVGRAGLRPGETVLDLGSGGGLDALLAARRVGPSGRVIGIDGTAEMVALARENARSCGIANAEFRLADLEALPLPDGSVDVILSNCVLNLVGDKRRAFTEAYRVLRPGGRLVVHDRAWACERRDVPSPPADPEAWCRCEAGALTFTEYREALATAGFRPVGIETEIEAGADGSRPPASGSSPLAGALVRAWKP
jgi:arsenite methyltransferase